VSGVLAAEVQDMSENEIYMVYESLLNHVSDVMLIAQEDYGLKKAATYGNNARI